MSGRILLLSAIISHVALGNVCLMQMAYAAEEPQVMHDVASMAMSSEACEHCPQVQASKEKPAEQATPCAGGHCIAAALPQATITASIVAPAMPLGLPSTLAYSAPAAGTLPSCVANGPPRPAFPTRTVVLRC
jgi:hypothetical protein